MIAYVDTSVLLKFVLAEPGGLKEFENISYAVSSELIRVEALRTMDRYRLCAKLEEKDYVRRISVLHELLSDFELIHLSRPILNRASQPFPTALGTLDAIHLSTCLLYLERTGKRPVLLSHDESLKNGAIATGLKVMG